MGGSSEEDEVSGAELELPWDALRMDACGDRLEFMLTALNQVKMEVMAGDTDAEEAATAGGRRRT